MRWKERLASESERKGKHSNASGALLLWLSQG